MSDTPRTDAFVEDVAHGSIRTWSDFARQLERELTRAQADLAAARKALGEAMCAMCNPPVDTPMTQWMRWAAIRDGKEAAQ